MKKRDWLIASFDLSVVWHIYAWIFYLFSLYNLSPMVLILIWAFANMIYSFFKKDDKVFSFHELFYNKILSKTFKEGREKMITKHNKRNGLK